MKTQDVTLELIDFKVYSKKTMAKFEDFWKKTKTSKKLYARCFRFGMEIVMVNYL